MKRFILALALLATPALAQDSPRGVSTKSLEPPIEDRVAIPGQDYESMFNEAVARWHLEVGAARTALGKLQMELNATRSELARTRRDLAETAKPVEPKPTN